ncbi:RNA 2',3'-cyclic phosphodiesterase [Candidatus Margulisiibacteriota bacterium]
MMRAFISVELPNEVKKKAAELIDDLKKSEAGVKWVEPKNLHITLKFLGWVKESKLDKVAELTARAVAGVSGFKAKFTGIGTFPEGKAPRVVWVGTAEGGEGLCKLAQNLETALSAAGFRSEAREFKPHLTIGRVKDKKNLDQLVKRINSVKDAELGAAVVDRIFIMKSTLTRSGPIYEKFKEVKL